ncbi:MAG: hypothetical protein SFW35_12850 [Chitinophagales bacterium]|nr:hypothetical protein [Chitinophagales bacterium]
MVTKSTDYLLISFYWAVIIALSLSGLCQFETNDDVAMRLIAEGSLFDSGTENLVFSGYLYGLFLKGLYALYPLDWYSLLSFGLLAVSWFIVLLCILTISKHTARFYLLSIFSALAAYSLVFINFTIVGGVVGMAGLVLMYMHGQQYWRGWAVPIAIVLFVLSANIRFTGLVLIIGIFAVWVVLLSNRSMHWIKIGLSMAGAAAFVLLFNMLYLKFQGTDWENHLSHLYAKRWFLDAKGLEGKPIPPNWSSCDVKSLVSFFHESGGKFSESSLKKVQDYYGFWGLSPEQLEFSTILKTKIVVANLLSKLGKVFSRLLTPTYLPFYLVALCGYLSLGLSMARPKRLGSLLFITMVTLMIVAITLKIKMEFRVLYLILGMVVLLSIFLWDSLQRPHIRWAQMGTLLVLICTSYVLYSSLTYANKVKALKDNQLITLGKALTSVPDSIAIIGAESDWTFIDAPLFVQPSTHQMYYRFYPLGWLMDMPNNERKSVRLGIKQQPLEPTYKAATNNKKVYILTNEYIAGLITCYLEETYGLKVAVEKQIALSPTEGFYQIREL